MKSVLLGLCLIFICFGLGRVEAEPADAPVQQVDVADLPWVERTWPQRRYVFYERALIESYRKGGHADPAWDEQVEHLLRRYCLYRAYADERDTPQPEGVPEYDDMDELQKAVRATGCKDPLVSLICDYSHPKKSMQCRPTHRALMKIAGEAAGFCERCTKPVQNKVQGLGERGELDEKYVHQLAASVVSGWFVQAVIDSELDSKAWRQGLAQNWCQNLDWLFDEAVPAMPVNDQVVLARLFASFSDDLDSRVATELMRVTQTPPDSSLWLAKVFRGSLYIESAWNDRGGGWAHKVKEEGWVGFEKYLEMARQELTSAWALEPDRSEPAVQMIQVGMGSGGDEAEWFERAVVVDPLDDRPYVKMLWAARPRWGGSYELMYDIGQRALNTGRFDTAIPDRFSSLLHGLKNEDAMDWLGAHADVFWPDMQRYVKGRSDNPTFNRPQEWVCSSALGIAYVTERPELMREYFEKVGRDSNRLIGAHVHGMDKRFQVGWLYAQTQPEVVDAINQSIVLSNNGQNEQAAELLHQTSQAAEDEWVRTHLLDRERVERWAIQYQTGEWVDLLEHGLQGWRPSRGFFYEQEDGSLLGKYSRFAGLRLICGLNVGQDYEMELKVKTPGRHRDNGWGGVGIMFDPIVSRETYKHHKIMISKHRKDGVWIQDPSNDKVGNHYFGEKVPGPNFTLQVTRRGAWVTVKLNGQPMGDGYFWNDPQPSSGLIALGAWHRSLGQSYEFQSFRVRRLQPIPDLGNLPLSRMEQGGEPCCRGLEIVETQADRARVWADGPPSGF